MEDAKMGNAATIRAVLAILQWWGFNVTVIIINKWIFQVRHAPHPFLLGFFSLSVFFLVSIQFPEMIMYIVMLYSRREFRGGSVCAGRKVAPLFVPEILPLFSFRLPPIVPWVQINRMMMSPCLSLYSVLAETKRNLLFVYLRITSTGGL
jgi:hypothetical protein